MPTYNNKLKLTIELVPATSWGNNLRNYLSKSKWDKTRKETYAKYGYRCVICGAEGRLNCHEVWEYDDKKHIQKFVGFIALCNLCHFVKHIGLAGILEVKGNLDYNKVVEHFMRVNNCDIETFEGHIREASDEWRKRSQYKWQVGLSEYANMYTQKVSKQHEERP